MSDSEKISLHILSGFLGSGKTTFLRNWLEKQPKEDIAILVNEFGEIGIDHYLLREISPDTVLLPNGCVCCQIRNEVKDALLTLYERRERGELPKFSRVILETTGLAEPAPIWATLLHDKQLQYHFAQGDLVTVVDCEHAFNQAESQPEWLEQIAAADKLVLSKTDRVDTEILVSIKTYLSRINPFAELMGNNDIKTIQDEIFVNKDIRNKSNIHSFRGLKKTDMKHIWAFKAESPRSGIKHPLTETCCIEVDGRIDWSAFAIWLSMLLFTHGSAILRMKALLLINDSETPLVIHGVQHSLHPPVHLAGKPPELIGSKIVFILRGIDGNKVRTSFFRFQQSLSVESSHG